jgi:hypothetical protein
MIDVGYFIKDDGSLNLSRLTKSKEGKQFLSESSLEYGDCPPAQLAYRVLHKVKDLPNCKGCKKKLTTKNFIDFKRGYRDFCSQSCSSKYGPSHEALIRTLQSDKFKENRKAKILERYGTTSMIDLHREKAKETSLARYGVDNPLKSDYAKQRRKEVVLEKYGVDTVWKDQGVQQKIKDTLQERYGVDSPLQLVDWSKINVSKGHQQLIDMIRSIDPNTELRVNDRDLISPQEVDIFLPEYKLAIEYNGLFWHSSQSGKKSTYHLEKTKKVERLGCQLIHIFEDEIIEKPEIVQSRLRNHLGKSQRIYARKCEIRKVDSKTSNEFQSRCHIQGSSRSKINLGLYNEGRLVGLMTFGRPRFNRNYDWELIRYCTELGVTIVGGASKLLTMFKIENPGSIISYADKRWSMGNLYSTVGFALVGSTKPGYFYVKKGTSKRINRALAQKHRLDQLLGDQFDSSKTESENMLNAGFEQVYDCGHLIFELK